MGFVIALFLTKISPFPFVRIPKIPIFNETFVPNGLSAAVDDFSYFKRGKFKFHISRRRLWSRTLRPENRRKYIRWLRKYKANKKLLSYVYFRLPPKRVTEYPKLAWTLNNYSLRFRQQMQRFILLNDLRSIFRHPKSRKNFGRLKKRKRRIMRRLYLRAFAKWKRVPPLRHFKHKVYQQSPFTWFRITKKIDTFLKAIPFNNPILKDDLGINHVTSMRRFDKRNFKASVNPYLIRRRTFNESYKRTRRKIKYGTFRIKRTRYFSSSTALRYWGNRRIHISFIPHLLNQYIRRLFKPLQNKIISMFSNTTNLQSEPSLTIYHNLMPFTPTIKRNTYYYIYYKYWFFIGEPDAFEVSRFYIRYYYRYINRAFNKRGRYKELSKDYQLRPVMSYAYHSTNDGLVDALVPYRRSFFKRHRRWYRPRRYRPRYRDRISWFRKPWGRVPRFSLNRFHHAKRFQQSTVVLNKLNIIVMNVIKLILQSLRELVCIMVILLITLLIPTPSRHYPHGIFNKNVNIHGHVLDALRKEKPPKRSIKRILRLYQRSRKRKEN